MSNFLVLFNHQLTTDQEKEALNHLNVDKIIFPNDDVKNLWRNVPPASEMIIAYLNPVINWLKNTWKRGDYVLVEGDFGATFIVLQNAFSFGVIPVYATTKRDAIEKKLPDGTIRSNKVFKHVIFRRYETV